MQATKATASFLFDNRREKTDGTYPVKLNIYYNGDKKRYNIKINLTEDQWEKVNGEKLRDSSLKVTRRKLNEAKSKAEEVIESMGSFSFAGFEDLYFEENKKKVKLDLAGAFDDYIKPLEEKGRNGSVQAYETAKNSFVDYKAGISLKEITPEFLEGYEQHMRAKGKSPTTIGIYTRHLRAVINKCINDGLLSRDAYPFAKYAIPSSRNVKKALSAEELKKVFYYRPEDQNQSKALDFWLLSYLCNGMNMKDVCLLKHNDISGDFILYNRAKTINTRKKDLRPIKVALSTLAKEIIWKRQTEGTGAAYLFSMLSPDLTPKQVDSKVHDFIKYVNKHMKDIGKDLAISTPLLTYAARHTHATVLKRKGASTEIIRENLGHASVATTEQYMDSFTDDVKKEYANLLTDM